MPRCPACSGEVREDTATSPCPHCGVTLSRGATTAAVNGPDRFAFSPAAVAALDRGLSQLGPVDDARFPPGRIFATRYRIVSLLGRGAMGEVYRADDLRLGQAVALKLMSEAIAHRQDGLRRLTDEVRLARGIAHPNVCRIYDIGDSEGWHFLSMEYVDGETLASLLRRIGQPPPAKALAMARQLCAGVAAAHDRGVLHRDLKPSNIMVDGRGQIRILDFGLAVAAADEFAGTPAYMSPEQLAGGPVTMRSDVYSLGRVLNEILPPGVDPAVSTTVHACLGCGHQRSKGSSTGLDAIQTLTGAGVGFTSLGEGIDTRSATGRLMPGILGSFAEFERERIRERVLAGLRRAKAHGQRLGRPKMRVPVERLETVARLSVDDAAQTLGVSRSTLKRWRRQVQQTLSA